MKIFKRILLGLVVFIAVVAVLFLLCIGPWPVYGPKDFTQESYYKQAIAAIDENAAQSTISENRSIAGRLGQPDHDTECRRADGRLRSP